MIVPRIEVGTRVTVMLVADIMRLPYYVGPVPTYAWVDQRMNLRGTVVALEPNGDVVEAHRVSLPKDDHYVWTRKIATVEWDGDPLKRMSTSKTERIKLDFLKPIDVLERLAEL